MKKQVLSLFLAVCMTLTLAPTTAWASEPGDSGDPPETSASEPTETAEPSDREPEPEPELASEPAAQADEEEPATSGTCGPNLEWSMDDAGTLTVSGIGVMANYTNEGGGDTPWYPLRERLKNVVIEDNVMSIGQRAFNDFTNLESVTISSSVTSIEPYAFSGCSKLRTVNFPESDSSLTNIKGSAFRACVSLSTITIPDSVINIGSYVFYGCTGLTSVDLSNSITSIEDYTFYGCSSLPRITIPNSVVSIKSYAFADCSSLPRITIPEGVASIGSYAFSGCQTLQSVEISNTVKSIGSYAFASCSALRGIEIPNSVVTISSYAFSGCSSLPSVTIPSSVTYIDGGVFYNCSRLTSVDLPNSITSIGSDAFCGCSSLPSLDIPRSVTSIGSDAFSGCSSLDNVIIPSGVRTIEYWTFQNCSVLTSITIPKSVTTIRYCAFSGCRSLRNVYYTGSEDDWKKITIDTSNGYNDYLVNLTPIYDTPEPEPPDDPEPSTFTVTFNPTGGTMSSASTRTVNNGELYGDLPRPTRSDFIFGGWYTSITIIGGKEITETTKVNLTKDQTLYARWIPIPKSRWDYFSFSNSETDFFNEDETRRDYSAGPYFAYFNDALEQYYPGLLNRSRRKNYLNELLAEQSKVWNGSCHGFPIVESLVNHDLLPVSAIDSDADDLPSVDKPRDNTNVRDLLNYYFLTQYIPALRGTRYHPSTSTGQDVLKDMASKVAGGTVYMFSYSASDNDGTVGHTIILDGGQCLPDGSYELIGQDNRFHGCTICEQQNGQWVDTGEPVTVSVQIPANGSSCKIFLDASTRYKHDEAIYYIPNGINERVYAFEATSTFDKFTSANPTGRAARNSVQALAAEDANKNTSVLYYDPAQNQAADALILKDQSGNTLVDCSDLENPTGSALENYWYTVQGTMDFSGTPGADGVTALTPNYAPVGLMAELTTSASEQDQYTVEGLAGGTISYAGSDGFASVSAEKADSVLLNMSSGVVTLEGNAGDFTVSVANTDNTVATVTGSSADTVTVTPTDTGIKLDAAVGTYDVTFTDTESDNQETNKTIEITNGNTSVDVDMDNSNNPAVCGDYKGKYTAQIEWISENQYKLSLTPVASDTDTFTAWQGKYDKASGKLLDIQKIGTGLQFTGTINPSAETADSLFVLDKDSIPVIRKYSLSARH